MNGRDLKSYFAKSAEDNIRGGKVNMIAQAYEEKMSMAGDEHGKLMAAVMDVLEAIPLKKCDTKGWCDLNLTCCLTEAVGLRNAAARAHARTKTEEAKLVLRRERQRLKKLKRAAKNEWMLQEFKACNETVLPGKGDRKNPYALWKLATKLKNGLDKWKKWDDSNVRNVNGDMASTLEENASIFQDFFNNLFSNDHSGDDARMEYAKMPKVEVDRQWGAPTMKEIMDELKAMKHTAAGVSGTPSVVW
jgi:hypothetical protein